MPAISYDKMVLLKKLYCEEKLSMRAIAEKFGVSIDAVVYAMRKQGIPRRSFAETNAIIFSNKKPSFTPIKRLSKQAKDLALAGAMLYWAEGYKTGKKNCTVDFANSDPYMITVFLKFLRTSYIVDEKRFRIYLYCYSDQEIRSLIKFWSNLTKIPASQFSKP